MWPNVAVIGVLVLGIFPRPVLRLSIFFPAAHSLFFDSFSFDYMVLGDGN